MLHTGGPQWLEHMIATLLWVCGMPTFPPEHRTRNYYVTNAPYHVVPSVVAQRLTHFMYLLTLHNRLLVWELRPS